MINLRYFKDQICDELDGACDYLKRALDFVKEHPDWSTSFQKMAEMEQGHATTLYKMFMECYAEHHDDRAVYMTQLRDDIMNCFSKKMKTIEDLKATLLILDKQSGDNKYPEDMYIPD